MVANTIASSQRVLKPARLTNMKTGQMLLSKGTKGSLTVLGASSNSLGEGVSFDKWLNVNDDEFPSLVQTGAQSSDKTTASQSTEGTVNVATDSSTTGALSWAECLNTEHSKSFQSNIPMIEHTPQVHLIFVNYKVSSEGYKTPLVDIAIAASKAVSEANVDAVQPTRNGWQIYVKTEHDKATLMAMGLDLAAKHVSLEARMTSISTPNVKITLKDLPLHEVMNKDILTAMKPVALIVSPVKYANIWINGWHTHLHNGDRFFYISKDKVTRFDKSILVKEIKACVFKPTIFSRCSRCDQQGHHASSEDCPVLVPPEVQSSTEASKGPSNPLSNLYVCPEGCTWENKDGLEIKSSEHEFQYEKLVDHGHADRAEKLLEEDFPIDVKKTADFYVPPDTISEQWSEKKIHVMSKQVF